MNESPPIDGKLSDNPSTFDRLTKGRRFVEIARDECTDQDQRARLTHIIELISVEMEELNP